MESTENISTEFNITNIFSTEQILYFIIATIAIIIVIIFLKLKGKKIKVKTINIGPFEAEVDEEKSSFIPAHSIAILNQPTSISGNPAILNTIKVRVYDRDNNPLKNKCVTITIDGKENLTENYINGQLSQISDDNGYVTFSGLSLLRRGSFQLLFQVDNVTAKARPFDVTPPGIDTNLENKEFNSEEYIDTLKLAISLSKGADKVIINNEEIK